MRFPNALRSILFTAAFAGHCSLSTAGGALRCVSLDYPPLVFAGPDSTAQGIAVDLVRQALGRANWTVEVEVLPWARALNLMQTSQRDCIFTIFRTPEREEFLDFSSKPLLQQPISLYARKTSGIRFDGDLSKLKDKSFAVVQSVNYGKKFEAEKAGISIYQTYTPAQSFLLLGRGRVDLTISNVYLATHQLSTGAAEVAAEVVQLQPPVETVTSYIAFAKGKHAQALSAFDAHIDEVLRGDDGKEFKKILAKHNIPISLRASLVK